MGKFVAGVGGGLALTALSSLFKSDKPQAAPAPAVMPEAPDSNDAQVRAAKIRQAAEIQGRSGRASTMLSDSGTSDKLGG